MADVGAKGKEVSEFSLAASEAVLCLNYLFFFLPDK